MKVLSLSLLVLLTGAFAGNAANPGAVDSKLKTAFAKSRTERVAVIGIGDSNQRFGGHGYSAAMSAALYQQFGSYGTGLINYRQYKEKDGPEPAEAPSELSSKVFSYWYIPAGSKDTVSWRNGIVTIPADHPMGVSGNLLFHLAYGTFPTGEGAFRPTVRKDAAPWTPLKSEAAPIATAGTPYTVVHYTMALPADPARDFQLQFSPSPVNTPIKGDFLVSSAFCENKDKTSGLSYSTLYAQGGQSLYDMLSTFRKQGPDRLGEYFTRLRETLNGKKRCIIMITSGLNDRNERENSIGPNAGLPSTSPEGFADNLQGIVTTLQEAWVKVGGTPDTIHFAFMPSHVLGDPDDEKLVTFRHAARTLAAKLPNASMIDLPALVSYQEMLDKRYYDKGTATNPHLDKAGYQALAKALATKLVAK